MNFRIGERIEGFNFVTSVHFNGMYGVIASAPYLGRTETSNEPCISYKVEWANGQTMGTNGAKLRRRKPPATGEDAVLSLFRAAPRHTELT